MAKESKGLKRFDKEPDQQTILEEIKRRQGQGVYDSLVILGQTNPDALKSTLLVKWRQMQEDDLAARNPQGQPAQRTFNGYTEAQIEERMKREDLPLYTLIMQAKAMAEKSGDRKMLDRQYQRVGESYRFDDEERAKDARNAARVGGLVDKVEEIVKGKPAGEPGETGRIRQKLFGGKQQPAAAGAGAPRDLPINLPRDVYNADKKGGAVAEETGQPDKVANEAAALFGGESRAEPESAPAPSDELPQSPAPETSADAPAVPALDPGRVAQAEEALKNLGPGASEQTQTLVVAKALQKGGKPGDIVPVPDNADGRPTTDPNGAEVDLELTPDSPGVKEGYERRLSNVEKTLRDFGAKLPNYSNLTQQVVDLRGLLEHYEAERPDKAAALDARFGELEALITSAIKARQGEEREYTTLRKTVDGLEEERKVREERERITKDMLENIKVGEEGQEGLDADDSDLGNLGTVGTHQGRAGNGFGKYLASAALIGAAIFGSALYMKGCGKKPAEKAPENPVAYATPEAVATIVQTEVPKAVAPIKAEVDKRVGGLEDSVKEYKGRVDKLINDVNDYGIEVKDLAVKFGDSITKSGEDIKDSVKDYLRKANEDMQKKFDEDELRRKKESENLEKRLREDEERAKKEYDLMRTDVKNVADKLDAHLKKETAVTTLPVASNKPVEKPKSNWAFEFYPVAGAEVWKPLNGESRDLTYTMFAGVEAENQKGWGFDTKVVGEYASDSQTATYGSADWNKVGVGVEVDGFKRLNLSDRVSVKVGAGAGAVYTMNAWDVIINGKNESTSSDSVNAYGKVFTDLDVKIAKDIKAGVGVGARFNGDTTSVGAGGYVLFKF